MSVAIAGTVRPPLQESAVFDFVEICYSLIGPAISPEKAHCVNNVLPVKPTILLSSMMRADLAQFPNL